MIMEGPGLEAPQGSTGIRLVGEHPLRGKESRMAQLSESELWSQISTPAE